MENLRAGSILLQPLITKCLKQQRYNQNEHLNAVMDEKVAQEENVRKSKVDVPIFTNPGPESLLFQRRSPV